MREDHVKMQGEEDHLQAKERKLRRDKPNRTLIF